MTTGLVRLDVTVPAPLVADLDAAATTAGVSRSALVRLLLAGAVQGNTGRPQTAVDGLGRPGEGDSP